MTEVVRGRPEPPANATERATTGVTRRGSAGVQAPPRAAGGLPYHITVVLGTAAGIYAVSLAAVTALQAGADAAIRDARRPAAEAIETLRAGHDGLEAAVARIEAAHSGAVDAYDALAARLADHEAALGRLAELTGAVEGTSAALPGTIRLPALSRTTTRGSSRPVTNATTAASGAP